MKNSISKSVLAIVATGILLTTAVAWFGLHSRKAVGQETSSATVDTQSKSAAPAASPAKPAPAPARPTVPLAGNASLAVIPISLTNLIDDADAAWFRNDAGMRAIPAGTQVYGGIEFWLQGAIHLQGLATRDDQHKNFRSNVVVPLNVTNVADGKTTVTERGKNIACLYLLGGTRYSTQAGERFADVLWHYTDGTTSRSGIQYAVHLRDWWRTPYEDPARLPNELTKVAWQGMHPARKNGTLRLYRLALVNPHPEKTIESLEFASAMKRPSLFVAALTLDPLMPGARPDNLTSDEMPDPELKGRLQLLVEDSKGSPLANAKVTVVTRSTEKAYLNRKLTTDDTGTALVTYPDTGLDTLDVTAEHDGYGGKKMLWDTSGGDKVPATYTLKLVDEVKIGGIVVNEEGNPVSEAEVRLYRFWRGSDDGPDKKGEQAAFSSQNQKTDAQGHWEASGLPETLMANIGFEIKHPDYLSAQNNLGDNSTNEKQLREETFKTILKRGLVVRGRVLDNSGNPVAGAKVSSGRRYYSDTQQTSSDAEGNFSFKNVKEGPGVFSVTAEHFAATSKTVQVAPEMAEIIFRLQPGNSLHAHVQDESGQPVADAQVGLENNGMDSLESLIDYSTHTDSNGDFTWDSAPNATLTFYIFHDGFEAKRDAKLTPNQDNIITLRRSRTLQGLVLDDATEQPVTQFTVRTGKAGPNDDNVYGVIRYKSFTAADGRFSMNLEEEEDNAVLVMADGYADKVEKFPDAQNNTVQIVIRLKPAASLSGVVLAPDGSPAPGVTVTAANSGSRNYVQLTGGRLRSYDSQTKVATTDEQGRFKLGSVPDNGMVVAAGDAGFARAPLAEVQGSGTVQLQAWGRIEGTLKIGGQPGVGKDLLFTLQLPGISTDFNGFKSTTDDQGKFSMEKVPPGDGAIVRLIQTSPNSWAHSDSTAVLVKSGETTQVTLGDNGAVIVGHVRYGFQPTNESPLNLEGRLSSSAPMPPTPKFNSPQEAQAFFKSDEWQAAMKLRKNYTLEIHSDGSFTADNVAPGNYSLNITARPGGDQPWRYQPVAQGATQLTVPDSFDPAQPIDTGEVLLDATPPPSATQQTIWR